MLLSSTKPKLDIERSAKIQLRGKRSTKTKERNKTKKFNYIKRLI
jgi:hypothetical protein